MEDATAITLRDNTHVHVKLCWRDCQLARALWRYYVLCELVRLVYATIVLGTRLLATSRQLLSPEVVERRHVERLNIGIAYTCVKHERRTHSLTLVHLLIRDIQHQEDVVTTNTRLSTLLYTLCRVLLLLLRGLTTMCCTLINNLDEQGLCLICLALNID